MRAREAATGSARARRAHSPRRGAEGKVWCQQPRYFQLGGRRVALLQLKRP